MDVPSGGDTPAVGTAGVMLGVTYQMTIRAAREVRLTTVVLVRSKFTA
jgi:hypothetical protein